MRKHQWQGRRLAVGDKVRLKLGTPGWAQHASLRDSVGEVMALVDDGTSLHRITVAFDGWRLPPGMYEEHFEKVDEQESDSARERR
jgi:hypothetical protein